VGHGAATAQRRAEASHGDVSKFVAMEDWEQRSLAAFRAVALEVRGSSIVTNGLTIKNWLIQKGSDVTIGVDLLPAEAFKALCVGVRKVYMQEGPAHFYKVHKVIGRYERGDFQERAAAVRADYELILRGNDVECELAAG